MKILFDTHTHTTISDGGHSPEQMLQAAAEKGFAFLTITDHFDIHERFPERLSRFDGAGHEEEYKHLARLKQQDFGITFLNGIEIAQAHQHKEIAEVWLENHDYDFVLGSCHVIRGHVDFYNMDYEVNPPDVLLKQYFEELAELCTWCCESGKKWFDSLAHLTYPLRYMSGRGDLSLHTAAIEKLFAIMVKNGIAMEINTGHPDMLCPDLPLLIRYYEAGGRLLTIGSDSHDTRNLGNRVELGIRTAKKAGFTECVYFENREMKFIKFD